MRQRIKIAAALVHDPTVLLLDEPFNGVDPRQRMHLMELLRQLGDDGRTVLFSSHILEEVETARAPHRGGRLRSACRVGRLRGRSGG
ncbi:AAA family ATPase [Nocardioides sp. B-3]|nr:AAA family ATPase [Nocardioides sp. B-3]